MVVGQLVKEDCSVESKSRMGTIVKATEIVLSDNSLWKEELRRWKDLLTRIHGADCVPDMPGCPIIRPGYVVSVRWQHDPASQTVHVFYNDCGGRSSINHDTNSVEVIK